MNAVFVGNNMLGRWSPNTEPKVLKPRSHGLRPFSAKRLSPRNFSPRSLPLNLGPRLSARSIKNVRANGRSHGTKKFTSHGLVFPMRSFNQENLPPDLRPYGLYIANETVKQLNVDHAKTTILTRHVPRIVSLGSKRVHAHGLVFPMQPFTKQNLPDELIPYGLYISNEAVKELNIEHAKMKILSRHNPRNVY